MKQTYKTTEKQREYQKNWIKKNREKWKETLEKSNRKRADKIRLFDELVGEIRQFQTEIHFLKARIGMLERSEGIDCQKMAEANRDSISVIRSAMGSFFDEIRDAVITQQFAIERIEVDASNKSTQFKDLHRVVAKILMKQLFKK